MSVNDASKIINDAFRVTLQILASLTGDYRGIIYNCNVFIIQGPMFQVLHSRVGSWPYPQTLG
jgi:hypothetical protein